VLADTIRALLSKPRSRATGCLLLLLAGCGGDEGDEGVTLQTEAECLAECETTRSGSEAEPGCSGLYDSLLECCARKDWSAECASESSLDIGDCHINLDGCEAEGSALGGCS
jgi:hypothetical protein